MKILILLRYPKLESSRWKLDLIEKLINQGFRVTLLFGDKSFIKQVKTVLKEFGFEALKKKKSLKSRHSPNLYKYFKDKVSVHKVDDLNSPGSEKIIKSYQPDYILLLGTGIIRKNILSVPANGAVHCHHGCLPEYRGVNTAEWNLFYENEVYITTHFVDTGIDTGDILLKKKIPLTKSDTVESLRLKCRKESVDLIVETFNKLRNSQLLRIPQQKNEGKQYYAMHPFFRELVQKKIEYIGV